MTTNRFVERILKPPSYGLVRNGELYRPTPGELFREFFARHNVLADKRNWINWVFGWSTMLLTMAMACHWLYFANLPLVLFGVLYAVGAASHATFYLHRYGAHRAFTFRNGFWLFVCKNLAIKTTTEEIYTISHFVHHSLPDQPGDPHNPKAGWLNCALSISNHHPVAWDLSQQDYGRLTKLIEHTGIRVNTYDQYQRWGTLCHPFHTLVAFAVNWSFWAVAFYALGGAALVATAFGYTALYTWGIRNFNYFGHGGGQDRRKEGSDFHRRDLSRNHWWPGIVGGEWHNNHHLYPNGARSGFLPGQLDLPWLLVATLRSVGIVTHANDPKEKFLQDHYEPWLKSAGPAKSHIHPPLL
jgi:sn-1 stearoyl-lipid 9-desaturase